jgi:hypothetical protein
MKTSTFGLVAVGLTLAIADLPPGGMLDGGSPIKEAQAVVGRPMTPVSAAGVARRTTRRMIVATSVYVATLPPSCTVVVIDLLPGLGHPVCRRECPVNRLPARGLRLGG